MILVGWKIRFASVLMILNFLVALLVVHRKDSIEGMTPALAILFASILFLFYGVDKFSMEYLLRRKYRS
jgi:putative oxidoreductase